MNFKKFKRLASVMLSLSMVLSTNMTGFAAEAATPDQADSVVTEEVQDTQDHEHTWQLSETLKGIGHYNCTFEGCTETMYDVIPAADGTESEEQPSEEQPSEGQPTEEETEIPTDNPVATIGDESYTSLSEAFAALANAQGSATLQMQSDAALEGTATYNLTGKNIQTNGWMITITEGSKIRLQGGTFENQELATPNNTNGAFDTLEGNHVMINADPGSTLTIEGNGTYKTKAVQMLRIKGNVTIVNGTFECTATTAEVADRNNYNGAVMFSVAEATGRLTMQNGTVTAKAGNESNEGMYGIFAYNGSTVTLGQLTDGGAEGPTIESQCAAIGSRADSPTATLTINGGTYKSGVGTAENPEGFNTVLYLATDSLVTINGGTFTAGVQGSSVHAISFSGRAAQTILINGGTFTSEGSIFYKLSDNANESKVEVRGGTFSQSPAGYVAAGYEVNGENAPYTVVLSCQHENSNLQEVKETEPTCFRDGQIYHWHCDGCGKNFAWKDSNNMPQRELTDAELKSVDKLNHDGVWVAPKEKTCKDYGIKGHYTCNICHRLYLSMDALMKDTEAGETNVQQTDLEDTGGGKLPHDYEVTDTKNPYVFTWEDGSNNSITEKTKTFSSLADLNAYEALLMPTDSTTTVVSVTRTCNVCGAEDSTYSPTIEITKEPTTAITAYDCTEGVTVTYTATATETPDSGNTDTTREGKEAPKSTFISKIEPLEKHNYTTTATLNAEPAPDAQDESPINYTPGTSTFTVTRKCTNPDCSKGTPETASSVKVYALNASGAEAELTSTCASEQGATLRVKGTFEDGTTQHADVTANIIGSGHREWVYHPYRAATCEADGNYAYYECGKCGEFYKNPGATGAADKLDLETDIKIERIPHNFNIPHYNWQDATKTVAKATFTCIKCGASITKTDLPIGTGVEPTDKTYSCIEEMQMSYPVTVKFNKEYVKPDGKDPYGDPKYKYELPSDPAEIFEPEYTGEVKKMQIRGHKFTATAAWKNTADTVNYHDITTEGIEVTLTCGNANCNDTVILPATATFTVNEDGEITGKTTTGTLAGTIGSFSQGTVEITKNTDRTAGFVEAFCTSDGKDVFDIEVKCTTNDGKPEQTYNKVIDGEGDAAKEEPLRVETATEKIGHKFLISDEKDEATGKYKYVYWENPNAEAYPDRKEDVTVTLTCENNPRHSVTLTGEKENVKLTKQNIQDQGSHSSARTCLEDGVNAWSVEVTYDGKVIKYFNTPGEPSGGENTSIADEEGTDTTPDEGETPSPEKIYVTKTLNAAGHNYDAGKFDWSSYANDGKVYYVYTCQNDECIGEKGELEDTNEIITTNTESYGTVTGDNDAVKTIRKFEATTETVPTVLPTCTVNGQGTTTATVILNNQTITDDDTTGVLPATGHTWDNATLGWSNWEKVPDAKPVKVTIGDEEYEVPDYQITLTRSCKDCEETEEVTGKLSDTTTLETAKDSFVKVQAIAHSEVTCTTDGTTTYAAVFYGKKNSNSQAPELVEGAAPENGTDTVKSEGHNFKATVDVDWDNMQPEQVFKKDGTPLVNQNGDPVYTDNFIVTASRGCSNTNCQETDNVPVTVSVTGKCGDTVNEDAEGNVIFTAAIEKGFVPTDEQELTLTNATLSKNYSAHNLNRVAGQTGGCGEISFITHYHCALCGKNFKNNAATTVVNVSFEEQGHLYGDPDFKWNVEGDSASATFKCNRCQKDESVLAYSATVGQKTVDRKPTCQQTGTAYYSVNIVFTKDNLPEAFTMPQDANELRFDGELEVAVPTVDHDFSTTNDAGQKVCKWCGKLKADMVKVSYVTDDNKVIRESEWFDKTEDITITPPTAPNQSTRVIDYWEVDGVKVAEGESLADAIVNTVKATNKAEIIVKAVYRDIQETANVTVAYKGIEKDPEAAVPVNVGSRYTVTAKEEEGSMYFSHWSNDADAVLSRSTSYSVYVPSKDAITIYAVYTAEKPGAETTAPTIAITNIFTTEAGGVHKVCFTSTMDIPKGFEMVESGLLYNTESSLNGAEMTLENGKGRKSVLNGAKTNTLSIKVSSDSLRVCARGYLRYKNAQTSQEFVIYSATETASYSSLTSDAPAN